MYIAEVRFIEIPVTQIISSIIARERDIGLDRVYDIIRNVWVSCQQKELQMLQAENRPSFRVGQW